MILGQVATYFVAKVPINEEKDIKRGKSWPFA